MLQRAARAMFHRDEIKEINSHIAECVNKEILYIRSDRNLHRNLGELNSFLRVFGHLLEDTKYSPPSLSHSLVFAK